MCVQFEQTKHVAERLAQSKLKKVATDVLSCARRTKNSSLLHTEQCNWFPKTDIGCGSVFLNICIRRMFKMVHFF